MTSQQGVVQGTWVHVGTHEHAEGGTGGTHAFFEEPEFLKSRPPCICSVKEGQQKKERWRVRGEEGRGGGMEGMKEQVDATKYDSRNNAIFKSRVGDGVHAGQSAAKSTKARHMSSKTRRNPKTEILCLLLLLEGHGGGEGGRGSVPGLGRGEAAVPTHWSREPQQSALQNPLEQDRGHQLPLLLHVASSKLPMRLQRLPRQIS